MDARQLLEVLKKISEEINKQIPLASNRFEEYETCPADADTAYTDALDQRYFEHQKRYEIANVEFFTLKHIKELFTEFCQQQKWSLPFNPNNVQYNTIKQYLLSQNKTLCDRIARTLNTLGKSNHNAQQTIEYLEKNIDMVIKKLCADHHIPIEYQEFEERFHMDERLAEDREQMGMQMFAKMYHYIGEEAEDKFDKVQIVSRGKYIDIRKSNVGYCDEHACLAVYRIFKSREIPYNPVMTIEKISIRYEEGDGHTFLAINREKKSELSDIANWGKDAILMDPWNKLVCFAQDYPNLPLQYLSYPNAAKWKSVLFHQYDRMADSLELLDQYFQIAELGNAKNRFRVLKDEYSLISLTNKKLTATRKFLYQVLKEAMPDNFNMKIKLFLTSTGNEFFSVLPGYKDPIIAIHIDFMKLLTANNVSSYEEVLFALATKLLEIKKFGVGITPGFGEVHQFLIDQTVIEKFQIGSAAIEYLRKLHPHSLKKSDLIEIPSILEKGVRDKISTPAQRIKNIITLLAKHPHLRTCQRETTIPEATLELAPFNPESKSNTEQQSIVKTLELLTSQLESLRTELIPYEFSGTPGKRTRDFCQKLKALNIDLNDQNSAEFEALSNLIKRAQDLSLPSIEYIYYSISGSERKNYRDKSLFQPMGYFRDMQDAIAQFVNAQDAPTAECWANVILTYHTKLSRYFVCPGRNILAPGHLYFYKKDHEDKLPTQDQRYFGNNVGNRINWQGFGDISPENHIKWTCETKSEDLGKALWLLGLQYDPRSFSIFTYEQLETFVKDMFEPIIPSKNNPQYEAIVGKNSRQDNYLFLHFSNNCALKTDMFLSANTYEQKFIEFYDANRFALALPGYFAENFNLDNETVHALLAFFVEVIAKGDENDKQVVKSFFLGRSDKRDIKGLKGKYFGLDCDSLRPFTAYVTFVFAESYKDQFFSLFTPEEKVNFIKYAKIVVNDITWQQYIQIYKLPYNDLTLACLEELLERVISLKGDYYFPEHFLIEKYLELHPCPILSQDTIRLIELANKYTEYTVRIIVKAAQWVLPKINEDTSYISLTDMILIYRYSDVNLVFPSPEVKEHYHQLLRLRINALATTDEKIEAYEKLILCKKGFFRIPIMDLKFRTELVQQWSSLIAEKYGIDDGSQDYFVKIKPVLENINESVSQRDVTHLFTSVANAIVSQWKISEFMGILIEPDKFLIQEKSADQYALTTLSAISQLLSKEENCRRELLEFLSAKLCNASIHRYALYIHEQKYTGELLRLLDFDRHDAYGPKAIIVIESAVTLLYSIFWDRPLLERAVLIEYMLIPATSSVSDAASEAAFLLAFEYVVLKLFPQCHEDNTDDEFARSILQSYLSVVDPFQRSFFLAGMLVAANSCNEHDNKVSVGKKILMLCETMGPAYIKLAQAIHSHPKTPVDIRNDLSHIKGRASTPHRWQLWRMVRAILPQQSLDNIKHLGPLLGSASYNLAVSVTLQNDNNVVLSLLRENARNDSELGFRNIHDTVACNKHSRTVKIQHTMMAIVDEAKNMSLVEMDHEMSRQQFEIAHQLYGHQFIVGNYNIFVNAVDLHDCGYGYRLMQRVHGIEFNDLPASNPAVIHCVAKSIMCLETTRLLSGSYFDSDRHGNQLRILVDGNRINIGLYDFGEMALREPSLSEINQLVAVIRGIPALVKERRQFDGVFDTLMTRQIKVLAGDGLDISYLMRVRKSLLALQDFQKHLNDGDMVDVLRHAARSDLVHPVIRTNLRSCIALLAIADFKYCTSNLFKPRNDISKQRIKLVHKL